MKNDALKETTIALYARSLFDQFGRKALAIAARRRREFEDSGEQDKANNWRRIRLALGQISEAD